MKQNDNTKKQDYPIHYHLFRYNNLKIVMSISDELNNQIYLFVESALTSVPFREIDRPTLTERRLWLSVIPGLY